MGFFDPIMASLTLTCMFTSIALTAAQNRGSLGWHKKMLGKENKSIRRQIDGIPHASPPQDVTDNEHTNGKK